jgi:hypothetical protein
MKSYISPNHKIGTKNAVELYDVIVNCIAQWIEENPTERKEIISVIFNLSRIMFCHQTFHEIKEQCNEIDRFCNSLKNYAINNIEMKHYDS